MAKETDTNDIWVQSLGLLFIACEPLTYDCRRSEEESKDLYENISHHAYYCSCVKRDLERGIVPKTWDQWIDDQNKFKKLMDSDNKIVEKSVNLDIDVRSFGNILTRLFG